MELVDLVEDLEEIIINKLVYLKVVTQVEILVAELVVAVELTQVVERILNQELDKALVDLEMVMAQDKELVKV